MKRLPGTFLVLACSFVVACGGDDERTIDISGDSPQEAAEEIADAVCDYEADCGTWSIECSGDGDQLDCEATHEESSYDECYSEAVPDVQEDLECAQPTAEEEQLINDCINGLLASGCISEEEINAYVEAIERGEDPDPPSAGQPAACDQLETVFEDC